MKSHARHRILRRDGGRCLRCGTEDNLTLDHIVAKQVLRNLLSPKMYAKFNAQANLADYCNLQTLCARCNQRKQCDVVDYRDDDSLYATLNSLLIETFGVYVSIERVLHAHQRAV